MRSFFRQVLDLLPAVGVACSLVVAPSAFGLPVLNGNTPSNKIVTIYPDHQDKNLFYLVPRRLKMAIDPQGQPEFLYAEVSRSIFTTNAVIQVSMTPDFDEAELKAAKSYILEVNPGARFAVVPFISSRLAFDNKLAGLVESADCSHNGGVVGSEQACIITLSSQGRRILLDSLKKRGTIFIQFQYDVAGVTEDAKKGYVPMTGTWNISGAIGGADLSTHPELFLNSRGLPIDLDMIEDTWPVLNEAFQISGMDERQATSILGRLSAIRLAHRPLFSPGARLKSSNRKVFEGSHFWNAGNRGDEERGCHAIRFALDNAQDVIREMNQAAYLLTARVKGRLGQKESAPDLVAKDSQKLKDIAREFDRIFPPQYGEKTENERYYWSIHDFQLDDALAFRLLHRDTEDSSVIVKEIMFPDFIWTPEQEALTPDIWVSGEFTKMGGIRTGTGERLSIAFTIDRLSSPLSRCLGPAPAIQIDAHLRIHAHCVGDIGRCQAEKVFEKDILLTLK